MVEPHLQLVKRGEETSYERFMKLPSGEERWVRVRLVPRRDPAGKVVGYYAISTDIHAIKLAQAEVGANLERFASVIAARQAALQRFEQDAAVRLPSLQQMAEDAYRLGRGTILELLDSARSRYELQQARIELVAALYEAQLRYLAMSGDLERRFGVEPPAPAPAR